MKAKIKVIGAAAIQSAIYAGWRRAGSWGKLGAQIGASPTLLFAIWRGDRLPTPSVFKAFGFERSVERIYRFKKT